MSVRASDTSFDTGSQFLTCRVQYLDDTDPFSSTNFAEPTRPPSYTFNVEYPIGEQIAGVHRLLKAPHKIGDCTLQLSNTKVYLDLDLSIAEQKEDFDQFFADRKRNSIVIRTLLSVRVHSCIEKLYNSKGRELRRALFSLKQIFQDDKELVHTFVNADGLTCLIKVGAEADQNYQNYILRAMGQIMLYVDGMEGVIQHNDTVSWLYSLIASKFRLVVKTSLKLLLVFVEYSEDNALVLAKAVESVDKRQGHSIWSHLMVVLGEKDGIDSELLVYAMTLINKTLSNVSDQDTFYDITDSLEEQKMDSIAQRHLSKKGNDLDLVEQFKIYELALKHEDGEEDINNSAVGSGIKWNRERTKSELTIERKSKRRNSLTSPLTPDPTPVSEPEPPKPAMNNVNGHIPTLNNSPSSEPFSSPKPWLKKLHNGTSNFSYARTNSITSSLNDNEDREKRRRERMAKWSEKQARSLVEDTPNHHVKKDPPAEETPPPPPTRSSSNNILEQRRMDKRRQRLKLEDMNNATPADPSTEQQVVVRSRHRRRQESGVQSPPSETHFPSHIKEPEKPFSRLDKPVKEPEIPAKTTEKIENKDVTTDVITSDTKLMMDMLYANQEVASKQTESDDGSDPPVTNEAEAVSHVKSMADKLQVSTIDIAQRLKPKESNETLETVEITPPAPVIVKKDSDIMWEKLLQEGSNNELFIEGFNFKGVNNRDDIDALSTKPAPPMTNGLPPPPMGGIPPPPPMGGIPLPPGMGGIPPPPPMSGTPPPSGSPTPPPNKKRTVRLFWKESTANNSQAATVWSEIDDIKIESEKFIQLFELKSKESTQKKQTIEKRNEIRVLDVKRSNAINIGMTKLPPPRTIKHAIIHMDEYTLNKEQIEKLLMMVPTEEEILAIQDATQADPDVALGSAEQFLKTLSSISELEARLNLWSFKLDYDILEKEVAEPLQDIKDGIEELRKNKTLRLVLSTLRTIGNLLNNTNVKGFDISYLSKVPEVKDTVHKQTLLHHVTQIVLQNFPDSSDLYSELGALTRCSRVDFDVLEDTLEAMERRCKNSWDNLKLIAKHESKAAFRNRQSEFLMKCARKIITLKVVHKRLLNRFRATLLFFGMTKRAATDTKVQHFSRIVSEFALEYRTARERVFSQKQKKHVKGERNRTRGKMIMEGSIFSNDDDTDSSDLSGSFKTRKFSLTEEQMKQKQMESALHSNHEVQVEKRTRSRSNRVRKSVDSKNSPKTLPLAPPADDVTDQIMEQLVKTATQLPRERSTPVGRRKRSRNSQRKSLRRTLKNGLTDEERAVIMGSY